MVMSEPQSTAPQSPGEGFVAESEPTVDPEVAAVAETAMPISAETPPWRIRHRTTFRLLIGVLILWLVGAGALMVFKHF
jgi:hypothetical protein